MSIYKADGQFQDHRHDSENDNLEEKDHQSLDNQVNQYFKDIRYTTQEYDEDDDDRDDDDDDEDDDEDEDEDDDDDDDEVEGEGDSDSDSEDYEDGTDDDEDGDDLDDEGKLLKYNTDSNSYVDSTIRRAKQYKVVKHGNATVTGENVGDNQIASYTESVSGKYIDASVINLDIQIDKELQDLKTYFPSITERSEEIDYHAVLGQTTSNRNDIPSSVQGNISEDTATFNKGAESKCDKQQTDLNTKRTCRFCGKTFQHVGSLGRHLDRQKGNALHPLVEVEKIRANVVRRGNTEAIKERKLKRTREYNRRDYVKERNRLRRKLNRKLERAKESYKARFYRMISHPKLPSHPSFPRMVLFFLPANMWPHDPPTTQTFRTLISWLEKNTEVRHKIVHLTSIFGSMQILLEKLTIAFENWQTLTIDERIDMWGREQRVVSQQLLGSLTVFDFAIRDIWARELVQIKKSDILCHENKNIDQFDVQRSKRDEKGNSDTQLTNTANQSNSDDESQEDNIQMEMDISGITQIGLEQLTNIDGMQLSTVPILNLGETDTVAPPNREEASVPSTENIEADSRPFSVR